MDHLQENKRFWDARAQEWVDAGKRHWTMEAPVWGNWNIPEAEVNMLPADMTGMDAIELGCGTAYVAAWMARRGARVTAIDQSAEQLATAHKLNAEHGAGLTLIEGNAEVIDLPDASFDFAISEYGASIWCVPELWLAEAARLLRPGGRLVFLGNHPLASITTPLNGDECDRTLHRSYRTLDVMDFSEVEIEPGGICFNRSIAGWMKLFEQNGFAVDGYEEIYAPDGLDETRHFVSADWARDYPIEQVWKLQKRG